MNNQTIVAISTPLGPGGIGIIRISGPSAQPILEQLFVRKRPSDQTDQTIHKPEQFFSHRLYYGHIRDPRQGHILDEVLAVFMQAPKSYTREDVVEIHSHSGFVVLDRLLSAVVDAGAHLAQPGDFSKRAFLNGRIDLSQAEAIIDLINAPCETAVHMANRQIGGGLRVAVEKIASTITRLRAGYEAHIEFAESDETDTGGSSLFGNNINTLLLELSALIQMQKDTAIYRKGAVLTIAGVPNVGKSSLLNKLVDKETAIVSEVPGTTRDIVRDYFSVNGVPVVVCDTAGLHDTKDPVECMGMQKARDHFYHSDIILLVLEATRELNSFEEKLIDDFKALETIVVINKDDLAHAPAVEAIQARLKDMRHIRVSAKNGAGIEKLKGLLFEALVSGAETIRDESVTPNLRQRKILEKAKHEIWQSAQAAERGDPPEVVSELLYNGLQSLSEISGNRSKADLYDHIFSQFCVGK